MDAGDLRFFAAVAHTGSMNRAAGRLNTVQSNVTSRIRQLEERLGVVLFERHSRGVRLTPAGRRLLPYAEEVARLLAEAAAAARDDGAPSGPLALGALETTAALRLSPLLTDFARRWPAVDLSLRTGTTRELTAAVREGALEAAFVCGPVRHDDLAHEVVFAETLVLATAGDGAALDAHLGRPDPRIVVFRAGCSYRQQLEAILARRGVIAPRLMELGSLDAIVGAVGAGLGVTLLPRDLLRQPARDGRLALHELPAAEAGVETWLIRRAAGHAGSAQQAFLAHVRERAGGALARVARAGVA